MSKLNEWKTSSKIYFVDEDKTVDFNSLTEEEKKRITNTWVKKTFEVLGYRLVSMD